MNSILDRFRDNNESNVNWQEFPDYDTIFTDIAINTDKTKQKQDKNQYQTHSMTISDMHEMHGFNADDFSFDQRQSLTSSTPSFISSNFATPPPLPIITDDNSSQHDNKLNDDFWSDLIDAATPCMFFGIYLCIINRMQLI